MRKGGWVIVGADPAEALSHTTVMHFHDVDKPVRLMFAAPPITMHQRTSIMPEAYNPCVAPLQCVGEAVRSFSDCGDGVRCGLCCGVHPLHTRHAPPRVG